MRVAHDVSTDGRLTTTCLPITVCCLAVLGTFAFSEGVASSPIKVIPTTSAACNLVQAHVYRSLVRHERAAVEVTLLLTFLLTARLCRR